MTAPELRRIGAKSDAEVLSELARVKALFQLRAIAAVMGIPAQHRFTPTAERDAEA